MAVKKVGILTGGGDAPGLNAVIRAVVFRLARERIETIGFLDGWKGVLANMTQPLAIKDVAEIVSEGGTIIGSSRTNPYKKPEQDVPKLLETLKKNRIDALIAVGGDDTLGVAAKLYKEQKINIVGVPKTIDNDLSCTDFTFGFDTAVNIAMEAMDKLRTTAFSHRRALVVECMGRHAGWITAYAGVAAGADYILIPEEPVDIAELCASLKRRRAAGDVYNIVAVSEGAAIKQGDYVTKDVELDAFGHVKLGGVGEAVAKLIEKQTGFETRSVVLGHLQRAGAPSAYDRILGTRYGVKAAEMVIKGEFGKMAALHGNDIVSADLSAAAGETKTLDKGFWEMAKLFFS
jgi:6-phosphofructokinase 1